MRPVIALLALAVSAPAVAQSGAYRLILTWSQGGITTVDYPSAARCEMARRAVEAEREARITAAERRSAAQGGIMTGAPWTIYALCIPG